MKRTSIIVFLLTCSAVLLAGEPSDTLSLGYGLGGSRELSSGAVGYVGSAQLENAPRGQILEALYGLIPGLGVYQRGSTADPSASKPTLNVRGQGSYGANHPLILVDGVERDASYIDAEEVESVCVLKDAASLALYGIRAADGVVNITTRRGSSQKLDIKIGYDFGLETPFRMPEMASASQWANALNQAMKNDGLGEYISPQTIENLGKPGSLVPSVDWKKLMMRNIGYNHDAHISLGGSSQYVNYYVYADYRSNRGFFRNTKYTDGINSQTTYDALKVRTNLDIKMTRTTDVTVNLAARIQQTGAPISGTNLQELYAAPAAGLPALYEDCWVRTAKFANPFQDIIATGESKTFSRTLSADLGIKQSLSMLTPGLGVEARVSYDNSADIVDSKSFGSSYYIISPVLDQKGALENYSLSKYGNDTEMSFSSYLSYQYMNVNFYAKAYYDRSFDKHDVKAAFIFNRAQRINTGANTSYRHHDYILNASYGYDGRYILNFTGNFSGSSYMPKGDKIRFYPAASLAWVASNEPFLKGSGVVDYLKVRGGFGIVGMDANLSYDMDTQFNGSGLSYIFTSPTYLYGLKEGDLPSKGIEPETEMRADLGVEFQLFKGLSGEVTGFYNRRTNIRTNATATVSGMVGIGLGDAFNGETSNRGVEAALNWKQQLGDFSYFVGGTLSFARNRIERIDESYQPYDYMYLQGHGINTFYGLVCDGYYSSKDFDAEGKLLSAMPKNTFASVRVGDVKYKDLNGDQVIDNYDYTYQLKSSLPEIYYGFRLGFDWRGLGFSLNFQGIGSCTVPTTLSSIYQPLYGGDKNVSKHYLANCWTPEKPEGRYPRLTSEQNENNFRASDLWTENGAYLKLRDAEIHYALPERLTMRAKMREVRFYLRGENLFSADSIKIMDPEALNFDYPTARTFTIGFSMKF